MSTKKHADHPNLTGEYRWGDAGQLVLFVLFLGIWITDSFVFHYSTFLQEVIPKYVSIPVAGMVLVAGWLLARGGMKAVFGTDREKPVVIRTGVFGIVRHPIYTGALLFYLGAVCFTLSIASACFWLINLLFYILISRYEERILTEAFSAEYTSYKKKTGMLFPKLRRSKN